MKRNTDTIQRFHFPGAAIRGAIVSLDNSYVEALNGHGYPHGIQQLLGQCLAASTLMNTHLKMPTRQTLQARGNGAIELLMAESTLLQTSANHDAGTQSSPNPVHQTVRALARGEAIQSPEQSPDTESLRSLVGNAQLVITLEPETGERYQGIVALDGANLADCLKNYFLQSEQLPTVIQLCANDNRAAGLLIQRIPEHGGRFSEAIDDQWEYSDQWEEVSILAESLTHTELLSLPADNILHRLFHQFDIRLFPSQTIAFACNCSQQRTWRAIQQIHSADIEEMLAESGEIVLDCEFCSQRYRFDRPLIERLSAAAQPTRH